MSDPCSLANIGDVVTSHLHISLTSDFDAKTLTGSVVLSLKSQKDGLDTVILDTRDLKIEKVTDQADGAEQKFAVAEEGPLGSALTINLAKSRSNSEEFKLQVFYQTSPNASGIQWLPKEQTDGKVHPYLFTQFQAIHCRSGVPCQDSPAVKITYSADITVNDPLVALMSALSTNKGDKEGDKIKYTFEQKVSMPSYLIALVIGALESRDIGPRTRVWAEKETVEAAAWEFAETEQYLKAAEEIINPYAWGRYDLLCLPGSFPYGGMENPCLTFVTPTLLAKDRSLTSVVAHEIAHSWTGNLVTNRNWENFWLNEGCTVFVERKIIGRLFGEKERQFRHVVGHHALAASIKAFGEEHNFTSLIPKLEGIDPDDAFSSVPYEKGSQFLYFLENKVGGPAVFEPFFKHYIISNSHKTVTSEIFKNQFLEFFKGKVDDAVLSEIDWNAWFTTPGFPIVDVQALFDQTLAEGARALADKWVSKAGSGFVFDDIKGWSTYQVVEFLEHILVISPNGLSADRLEEMNKAYAFGATLNSEIRLRWLLLCINSKYEDCFPNTIKFLSEQGRMKFLRPLYKALANSGDNGKKAALETFDKMKDSYHNIAKKMVAQDLGVKL